MNIFYVMSAETNNMTKQHKFTHLGKAPYSLVGYFYDAPMQDSNGAWHGGQHQCDHCGRGISHVFQCKSSDGKTFNLGSQHVEQLGDEGLTQAVRTKAKQVAYEARKEREAAKRAAFWEKQRKAEQEAADLRLANLKSEYERIKPELIAKPHPNAYFAKRGKTMLDYVNYFLEPDGDFPKWHSGRVWSILHNEGAKI